MTCYFFYLNTYVSLHIYIFIRTIISEVVQRNNAIYKIYNIIEND